MTIRTKLILSFSLVACVPLVGGAIGLLAHRHAAKRLEQTALAAKQGAVLIAVSRELQAEILIEQAECTAHTATPATAGVVSANSLRHTSAIKDKLESIRSRGPDFGLDAAKVRAVETAMKNMEAQALSGVIEPASFARAADAARDLVAAVDERSIATLRADDQNFKTRSQLYDTVMGVGTLVGVAMGVTFGVLMSLAVTRHIGSIARHMWDATCNVAVAAGQVAVSSRELASVSSQQAASLEETGASLTEVNSIVKANANHANEVRTISHANRQASDRSAAEVADLQTAMKEMTSANANIAKIVQSIDEIAFQTNILALNAAVEAARAGESGAGFAVVAEEVRSLAQRSAVAARETGAKIEDALSKSRRGAEIAANVEQSLRKVIEDNRRVDSIVAQIAEASAEQAKGLDLAVNSMARIDRLTQDNTASAESTAEAAQMLDAESRALKQELSGLMDQRDTKPEPHAHRLHQAQGTKSNPVAVTV